MTLRRLVPWLLALGAGSWTACSSFDASAPAPPPALAEQDDAGAGTGDGAVSDAGADAASTLPVTAVPWVKAAGAIGGFAAGGGGLAWTVGNLVYGAPAGDVPHAVTVLDASDGTPTGALVVNGATVHIGRKGGVSTCPLAGECLASKPPFAPCSAPWLMALVTTSLEVVEQEGPKRIAACPATNCTSVAQRIAGPLENVRFFASSPAGPVVATNDAVLHFPTGTPDALATATPATGLASDGQNVYWLVGSTGKLVRDRPSDGVTPIELEGDFSGASDLVNVGEHLYWLVSATGRVMRCTKPDCADPALVVQLAGTSRFALGDRLYLLDDTTGRISAAPRP